MSSLVPNFDRSLPTTCPIDLGTSPDEEAAKWGSKPKAAMLAASAARRARASRTIAACPPPTTPLPPVASPVDPEPIPPWAPIPLSLLRREYLIRDIQSACAAEFGASVEELLSHRRTKTGARGADVVTPRHVAIYLSKVMTPCSLPRIGRLFGGRDHSTALYAVGKIASMIDADPVFGARVQSIRERIEAER